MQDSEPETFVIKSMPEKFSDILDSIGISSTPKEIATDEMEKTMITIVEFFRRQQEWLLTKAALK